MSRVAAFHSPRLLWQPLEYWSRARRPAVALQAWLADPGSLTARLTAKSEGQFRVKIVRQVIGRPTLDECLALGVGINSLALIREVILNGNNQPWVFARSLLPLTSLTGKLRHLRKQNTRPLGAFLFSQPHLTRSPINVALIHPAHNYVPAALYSTGSTESGAGPLWGRRSVFYLNEKPLLVSEVFLPDFVASL